MSHDYYLLKLYFFKVQEIEEPNEAETFPDDAFLMVTQLHWEDDVVWDGNEIKHKVNLFIWFSIQYVYYISDF